jgi:Spy/CpxP family protein refolding chaperone
MKTPTRSIEFPGQLKRVFKLGVIIVALISFGTSEIAAQSAPIQVLKQQGRKQRRQQERAVRRIEQPGGNKLAPASGAESEAAAKDPVPNVQNSFDGIRNSGPRGFNRRFFSNEERQMVIPGFGRPVVYLVILRQLNLTEQQKQSIKAISQRVGFQLRSLRLQYGQLDNKLEEAIYGETFEPNQIDELSAQAGQKHSEIMKLQAGIEAEFRQILTPDQHYVFRYLIGEMLLPQRRVQPNQNRQRMQRRIGRPANPE